MAALFVLPEYRGRGIGRELVFRCESEARAAGFERLYLYTGKARDYYLRLGWSPVADDVYEKESVTIMHRTLLGV